MSNRKNIGILIGSLGGGGAERVVSKLSLYLSDKFNRNIILYRGDDVGYLYKGNLIDLEAIPASNNPISKLKILIKRIKKLKQIKREHNIEITISFLQNPNILNIFSRTGDKIIVSVRSFLSKDRKGVTGFYNKLYGLLIRLFYNRADLIIAVSQGVKNDLIQNYGVEKEKVKVIYNPYDIEKIRVKSGKELEDEYQELFNSFVITTMGRLTKPKGQWHLIRAFKEVKEKVADVKLVILGEGKLEKYLKELSEELNLEQDVHFLGFKDNPFKFISNSDLFVFPSLYEGFPNALSEAMACGVPVISSDCMAGPREILAPGTTLNKEIKEIEYAKNGILVPVCDGKMYNSKMPLTNEEITLKNSIIKVLTSKKIQEKYANRAKDRVKDFSLKKIMTEYENIL